VEEAEDIVEDSGIVYEPLFKVWQPPESGYYVMMKSTHARPVLVHPHHALKNFYAAACDESRSWATDSDKTISVES
jgi:hypothetical protein